MLEVLPGKTMDCHEDAERTKLIDQLELMARFENHVTKEDDCYLIGSRARQLGRAEIKAQLTCRIRHRSSPGQVR